MTFTKALLATTALLIGGALVASPVLADSKKDDTKWDVNNPPGKKKSVPINVTEGTWMSLDVSPDGKTIAFDLLGDIYTIPVTGGTATNIASGMAWEIQPRFSPDGSRIAFTSDRAGGDNIWTMAADGSDMQQVTDESFRLLNNPTWSPDGEFIAARKHFTTSRSLGTGEIWLYHTSGGSGVQLTKKPSDAHQKEIGEPMFSPDGRYVYYTANTTSGPIFEYAQDSNTQLFEIKKYDMETGEVSDAVGGAGGAVRPTPSPDGKSIAYVKRVRAKSMLFIKDLESGEERMVFDHLDQDMQETWAVYGVYPNMDWSPDSQTLYFWAGGQIHSVDVTSGDIDHIDFRVKDSREIMAPPRPKTEVSPDTLETKMPRYAAVSPDGKSTIFESLGKLYIKNGRGIATRLTQLPDTMYELDPAWSRDSKTLTFVTWNDDDLGAIHSMNIASGKITTLTQNPGHFRRPAVSPDGDYITYEKSSGGYLTDDRWSDAPGIYVMALDGSEPVKVRGSGSHPHFGADDLRIFFTAGRDGNRALISTNLLGDQERVHASAKLAQSVQISPSGKHIAFRENYNLFVMPALSGPQNVAAGASANALPVTKLSDGGATYPSWSEDGATINWTLGPNLYSVDAAKALANDDYIPPTRGTSLSLDVPAAKPDGLVALTNVRIITMASKDGGVIENGTILIDGDRIKAVGESVQIPTDATTVDLKGKTIMPGLVDAHAHGPQGVGDLTPQQNWSAMGHLALGVTTIFDPSTRAAAFFPAAEMQRAGKIISPRLFSTGEIIYGAKAPGFFASISDEDDAQEHVSRLKNQGAHGVKNYNQPRREQRQQVVKAARDNDIMVVAEGGSLYHMDMSMVVDGNTSIEHNLPQSQIYDDVIQLYSQTKVAYVPTLAVTYGGMSGELYFYQESDVWKHPILSKHVPADVLQARAVRRITAPDEDFVDAVSGATSKKLADAGVLVAIGAHGQREGLAAHWEMWSFARGGMTAVEALRAATTAPAEHLGFLDDIGSLERGKLADLVILSDNPMDDIRHTDNIEHVMIGGRLYEAETLNEVHTGNSKRAPYWFEKDGFRQSIQ
ncbi:amidohydrolase family protein [Fretibacter rubidus]|uniref:amidohydrolase family protein n=1 Tax=Fretibacter rubidus TaxID=570162 RepID=UPI00352AF50E